MARTAPDMSPLRFEDPPPAAPLVGREALELVQPAWERLDRRPAWTLDHSAWVRAWIDATHRHAAFRVEAASWKGREGTALAAGGIEGYELLGRPEPWTRVWTQSERPCVSVRTYPAHARGAAMLASDALSFASSRAARALRSTDERSLLRVRTRRT